MEMDAEPNPSHRLISGPGLLFGDDVNTDELHPSAFYSLDDARVRSGFLKHVAGHENTGKGDLRGRIILAGRCFGIGSSRETGARVFSLAGIQAIVACSFANIFFRNVMNLGLPAFKCPSLGPILSQLHQPLVAIEWEVSLCSGQLRIDEGELSCTLPLEPMDPYWRAVWNAGGLMAWLQQQPAALPTSTSTLPGRDRGIPC